MSWISRCRRGVMEGTLGRRKQESRTNCFHPDGAADIAQDRTIVTTGTSRFRAEAGKAHRRSAPAPALAAATGRSQDSQRGPTSVASKGRELSRSGLVRLGFNLTVAGGRLTG